MDMKEWLTLDKAIEEEEQLMKESCDSKEYDIAKFIRDCFVELKQRRESDLRPATKFLSNDVYTQYLHVTSEVEEFVWSFRKWWLEKREEEKTHTIEELIDVQMSIETLLAKMGLDEHQRREARRKVIEKNLARGYYKDGVTNED